MYVVLVICLLLMSGLLYFGFKLLFGDKNPRKDLLTIKVAFKRVIKRHLLSISEVDIFRNRLIAIDRKKSKLILIVHENEIIWERCFNLDELILCKIHNTTNNVSGCIENVKMELKFNNDHGIISFIFFDDKKDDLRELPSRIKKSRYWRKKIQFQMNAIKTANAFRSIT